MGINYEKICNEFKNLSPGARTALLAAAGFDLAAKTASLVSLSRRPASSVRGPKWAWVLAQSVNGVGPAAYWLLGRI